jgi:hypothetical protein
LFNSQTPGPEDLPTSKQLIRSTIAAAIVAIVVLVTTVLPAEYGVDPTGIGTVLGLTKMGEIKTELAQEEQRHSGAVMEANGVVSTSIQPSPANISLQQPAVDTPPQLSPIEVELEKTDTVEHTLAPGEGIEFKLEMKKDAIATYRWATVDGKLNYDTHGDGYRGTKQSISYKKGRMVTSDKGTLKAAFDGYHGWFWRNRDTKPVTFKLETSGDYIALKRMM